MNLFVASVFRFQDPNWAACTATSARSMLNFIKASGSGGKGFIWRTSISAVLRDRILAWERSHDTMTGGFGSDPHGWRNALNYYGWGPAALNGGAKVYDDRSFASYDYAMKAAVRAIAATRKPVGLLGWRGAHAQMVTGYYGLVGDPFEKDALGKYTNHFTVGGFYLTDPLRTLRGREPPLLLVAAQDDDHVQVPLPALLRDRQPPRRSVHGRRPPVEGRVVRQVRDHPAPPLTVPPLPEKRW